MAKQTKTSLGPGKNAEKGDRKTGSASKNTDKIFETSKITDWIKTKPSSVLTRVREREERASENWKGTAGYSSLASKFSPPFSSPFLSR
mmetsp:Transcript_13783/g.34638  ORF Transcript_13783/g.34638 Transcript_13783/m.34638 type:complete len:89 (-) Transcript_13783:3125-3391(-)